MESEEKESEPNIPEEGNHLRILARVQRRDH